MLITKIQFLRRKSGFCIAGHICVSLIFVGLSDTEEESCVSGEDEGTQRKRSFQRGWSLTGDEWEEEKEDEDVHDDLGILAVSEDNKTGEKEYLKSTSLTSFFFFLWDTFLLQKNQ